MDRPTFNKTLKHAHHFTVKNLGTFLPLALKTLLLCIVLGTPLLIWAFLNIGTYSNGEIDLTPLSRMTPVSVIFGFILALGTMVALVLTLNPLYVSIYRRALLDEEVERSYLKRIFAKRELNVFIAGLKVLGVFLIFLVGVGLIGLGLFALAVYMKSMLFNIIAAIVGGLTALVLSLTLMARLLFVFPNVALDRGSKLKTAIMQSRGFTLLLVSIWVFVNVISQGLGKVLDKIVSLIDVRFMESPNVVFATTIVGWVLSLFIFYFITIFLPAAISYIYKFATLKEGVDIKSKKLTTSL